MIIDLKEALTFPYKPTKQYQINFVGKAIHGTGFLQYFACENVGQFFFVSIFFHPRHPELEMTKNEFIVLTKLLQNKV